MSLRIPPRQSIAREDKDLSEHFRLSEFRCKGQECRGLLPEYIDPALITFLEAIRARFNAPVEVLSGFRCQEHNAAVGGAEQSQHLLGRAADIRIPGIHPHTIYHAANRIVETHGGVGYYPPARGGFVHVDARGSYARW